ncbi:MAG: hypothetical protein C0520_07335 [Sphingopyxis sp.]|nr:hypothetical protein [Sphingopyxis sp.]
MTSLRKNFLVTAALVGFALAGSPAYASDTDIFASCDAMGKPGKSPTGLSSAANSARFSDFSQAWMSVVSACDAALAHPKLLPAQTLRRAHLLRARAMAHVRGQKFEEALKDIDAAEAAARTSESDPLYARSFDVSLDLIRALILDRTGKGDEALLLARRSAAARPLATEVQRVAAHLLMTHRQQDDDAKAVIAAAGKLDPDFLYYQASFFTAVSDFRSVANIGFPDPVPSEPTSKKQDPSALVLADLNVVRAQLRSRFTRAYAKAATGDVPGARAELASTKERYDALVSALPTTVSEEARKRILGGDGTLIDAYEARINARIALAEGRRQDAGTLINGKNLPLDPISTDLFLAMQDKPPVPGTGAGSAAPIIALPTEPAPDDKTGVVRKLMFDNMIWLAVLAPETIKTNSVYKRSRPNLLGALAGAAVTMGISLLQGVENTDGFSAKLNKDGSVRVSLTGATPAPAVVREMTLLRAAELATENKKPAFEIVERDDYARYQTTSRDGFEISRVATGYKSDVVIRFVDAGSANPRALDARKIVDALGPFYYKDDKR